MNEETPLKLYWSSSLKNGKKNFGDWLSPVLCQQITGREVVHSPPNQCDLVGIGSILQRVKHHFWNRRIHIWGSGFITAQEPVKARHHYAAVRGKKTAELIKGAEIEAFGDPGLLVNLLLPGHASIPKRHRLGVIPHYKDQLNPYLMAIVRELGDAKVLDIFTETNEFLKEVASCETILSSSLHGLVVADAFGIQNAWIKLSDSVRGDDFKFKDYYSIFDFDPSPINPAEVNTDMIKKLFGEYRRDNLSKIQQSLLKSFPNHFIRI